MGIPIEDIDCAGVSPVEKMELADVLYDVALQQLEAQEPPQMAVPGGAPWDQASPAHHASRS